ncbi:MAG: outer membrane beta-barrel domain-containing protein [Bacteriovoracaceae bacterium]
MKLIRIVLKIMAVGLLTNCYSAYSSEKDLYDFLWLDQDKRVYVLQNKVFKKKKSFFFQAGYLIGLSNEFQDTKGFHFGAGYHFTEQLGIEVIYNSYSNSDNDATINLREINEEVPFTRKFNSLMGVMVRWDPFYGKFNIFNNIIYFDWTFAAGLGKIETESNANTVADPNSANAFTSESYSAGLVKTAFKIHVTERWSVDTQLLRTIYNAPGPKSTTGLQEDSWRGNSDFILSVGFSF